MFPKSNGLPMVSPQSLGIIFYDLLLVQWDIVQTGDKSDNKTCACIKVCCIGGVGNKIKMMMTNKFIKEINKEERLVKRKYAHTICTVYNIMILIIVGISYP